MLRLSEERRQPVRNGAGEIIGRVVDLVIRLDDAADGDTTDADAEHPRVRALIVGSRQQGLRRVPWSAVDAFDHTEVRCVGTEAPGASGDLGSGELLLVRDVLDTQVVDLEEKRLSRVGDVLLTRNADGTLRVAAVEVGASSLCRRLGLRALGNRLGEDAIDWADLHLTSARGHQVQLATPGAAVHRLDATELADLLHRVSLRAAGEVLAVIPPERAADVLAVATPDTRKRLTGSPDARRRFLRHRRRRPRRGS